MEVVLNPTRLGAVVAFGARLAGRSVELSDVARAESRSELGPVPAPRVHRIRSQRGVGSVSSTDERRRGR